jgi:hypothetical protein
MKKTLVLGGAWLAASVAAVGIGFGAVSLVDASASPATAPPPSSAAATAPADAGGAATTPLPPASSGEQATAGGTVLADCVDGVARLAAAPAPGWAVEQYADHVEFRSGNAKVEVHVGCVAGAPVFTVEGPGGDDDATPSVTPAPAVTPAPSATPSSGGSDDPPGDDHGSGGSDDPPGDDHGSGGHGADD